VNVDRDDVLREVIDESDCSPAQSLDVLPETILHTRRFSESAM
jgi:hypothetical protein